MVEDWLALIGNMNSAVRDLRQAAPEVMKTFTALFRRLGDLGPKFAS